MPDAGLRPALRQTAHGVSLSVKLTPRAGADEIVGLDGEALKIRIKAPPVEGRANEALLAFLARRLGVPRAAVELVSGAGDRRKVVRVSGLALADVEAALQKK